MALVFQYGSNCSAQRLNAPNRLNGSARCLGWAQTVDNYELNFDVWSTKNECATADIVPGGRQPVQGVLFEVPDALMRRETARAIGRKSFDGIEGNAYESRPIRVRRRDGSIVEAQTYCVRDQARDLLTSLDYVQHIIQGLREHNADNEYIDSVKEIAAANNPAISEAVRRL